MTPLEAAKELATFDEPDEEFEHQGRRYYLVCGRLIAGGHADDCPWPMLPQIVQALERLEVIDAEIARLAQVVVGDGHRLPLPPT